MPPTGLVCAVLSLVSFLVLDSHAQTLPDATLPGAKESYYSSRITHFLKKWPPPLSIDASANPIWVRAIRTPDHPNYIGMIKRFSINAPLAKVIETTEDFENYPKIWEDLVSVKVVSRDTGTIVTESERESHYFFIKNFRFKQMYVFDKHDPNVAVYRHQLVSGNSLNYSDGLIVFEKSNDLTQITVLDFFDANFGVLKAVAEGLIWKKSMENSYKDDVAFKSKLEHPDWGAKRIAKESDAMLDRFPIKDVLYLDSFSLD